MLLSRSTCACLHAGLTSTGYCEYLPCIPHLPQALCPLLNSPKLEFYHLTLLYYDRMSTDCVQRPTAFAYTPTEISPHRIEISLSVTLRAFTCFLLLLRALLDSTIRLRVSVSTSSTALLVDPRGPKLSVCHQKRERTFCHPQENRVLGLLVRTPYFHICRSCLPHIEPVPDLATSACRD